jgi:rod shape determining protein RodA
MYSTDGGEFHYHTKSHLTKLIAFFILMLAISFFNIKFWHFCSYFLYGIIILLLIWVSIYGIKASGSQRWINLYFLVLQPSELMKIGIILCLAKYYHRLSPEKVNSFVSISVPLTLIIIPIIFVLSQPDLGTSVLIASSGLIILWLGGSSAAAPMATKLFKLIVDRHQYRKQLTDYKEFNI